MKKVLSVLLSVSLILSTFTFNVSVKAAETTGNTKAKLIFTFDDGWKDTLTVAAPILSAAGFKGTAYVCKDASTSSWGAAEYMNVADLNTIYNQYGWDVSNHTVTHPNDGKKIDQTTLQKLTKEYKDAQDWLLSNNWVRGAYHVAYPSGMYSDSLINILKGMGIKTGRTTDDGMAPNPVYNFYKLPVQYVENGNVSSVEKYISSAVQSGSIAILMIHKVEPEAGNLVITKSAFQEIVNYAKTFVNNSQLEVLTMSELYNQQTGNQPPLTNAEAPKITTQPTDVTVSLGGTANLTVAASVSKGSLTYQWYRNTTNSNTGGTSINGETSSSYSAPTTTAGTTYYYCVVTNTDNTDTGNKTATATSNTAKVTVNTPTVTNAETPKITAQPTDVTVNLGGTANLGVTASLGKGTLTYQWYSNTTNSNSNGTIIAGTVNNSYSAPTTTAGTTYYYCVITNTDNTANGNKTASTTSSAAKVVVNTSTPVDPTSITIDGKESEWTSIPVLASATGQNITILKVTNDSNYFYICIQGNNLSSKYGIFLDTDNNSNTGYKNSMWSNGSDYYIESGILYKSKSSSWNWQSLGTSSLKKATNSTVIEIRLARSAINVVGGTLKIGVVNYNNSWGISSYLPLSGLMPTYQVK